MEGPFWKDDWESAREHLIGWWEHRDCAICVTAPKDEPWEPLELMSEDPDPVSAWTNVERRVRHDIAELAHTYFGGEAFPYLDTQIGPGSLGLFLGAEPGFAPDTVWYRPWIEDPEACPSLRFDPENEWFQLHHRFARVAREAANGRFLVGMPDLIENLDTLAQLRDTQTLMEDLIERPDWVRQKIEEINHAFFEAFDGLFEVIRDDQGGNAFAAFRIWGPGKTAKVQCDALAMISPTMFRDIVRPSLAEQCQWLDYSMFHLDGTQAMVHLDYLLEVERLNAIEWTPQAGIEGGGNPRWYPLYKRIKAAGKSVQAIGVEYDEVLPLLDAVGPEGLFVMTCAPSEYAARRLVERVRG